MNDVDELVPTRDDAVNAPDAPAGTPEDGPAGLRAVLDRLGTIESQLAGFAENAALRESVIAWLFDDNQRLRSGEVRAALVPVISDLIDLRDALARESGHLTRTGAGGAAVLDSLVVRVERTLARYGVDRIDAEAGDAFDSDRHEAAGVAPTGDRSLDLTVASVTAPGFIDRPGGRVLRPAAAIFHRYRGRAGESGPGSG